MRILITGGTGSLGHALVAHWLKETDHRLIVFSRDELKQAHMREEFPSERVDFWLGDIRDSARLRLAFDADVDIVVHAAALKRVDATARDPIELVATNILGSLNVLRAALGKVKRCLLISTDKACQAANGYGISKAMAESLFTTFNAYSVPKGTMSGVVRYGNVVGSRGSAVGIWRKQKAEGVPLTVTHRDCTRFLITFPAAIQMIETALAEMEGGEIFVPRLKAARMSDLAEAVAEGAPIAQPSGLRPGGEKLHETLMTEEEAARALFHPTYGIIQPELTPWRVATPPRPPQEPSVCSCGVCAGEMLTDEGFRLACEDHLRWRALPRPPLMTPWKSDTAPRMGVEELRRLVGEI